MTHTKFFFGILVALVFLVGQPSEAHAAAVVDCGNTSIGVGGYSRVTKADSPATFANAPSAATQACHFNDGEDMAPTYFYGDNGQSVGASDGTAAPSARSAQSGESPDICSGTFSSFTTNLFTCMWRGLMGVIGNVFISAGVLLAEISGFLFEFCIQNFIVKFGVLVGDQSVRVYLNQGWTIFRNLANIVIIGMFVFTAISLILGNVEFGDKRRIARVLIIAILLNFSLLFTELIVDASNFTASQFYNSMILQVDAGGTVSAQSGTQIGTNRTSAMTTGIANRFMQYIGVNGIFDSGAIDVSNGAQSGWIGFIYGLLSFVLLAGVSFIFLYGAYLIFARAVLMVFLMVVSAIAFASWLIPGDFVKLGWERWWRSLLNCAVLGPILMIFLWVTLTISSGFQSFASAHWGMQTLGQLLKTGTTGGVVAALANYIFILAMLFVSLRVSSMFSAGIADGGVSRVMAGLSLLTPLLGASALGGVLGRNLVAPRLERLSNKTKDWAGEQKRGGFWANRMGNVNASLSESLGKAAKKDFNFMNTNPGKQIAKAAGLPGAGTSSRGGYVGIREAKVKAFSEQGDKAKASKEMNEKIAQEASAAAVVALGGAHDAQMEAAAQKIADATTRLGEAQWQKRINEAATAPQKEKADANHAESKKDKERIMVVSTEAIKNLSQQKNDAKTQQEKDNLQEKIDSEGEKMKTQLRDQDAKIKGAKDTIDRIVESIEKPVKEAEAKLAEANREKEDLTKRHKLELGEKSKLIAREISPGHGTAADAAANIAVNRWGNAPKHAVAWLTGGKVDTEKDPLVQLIRKKGKSKAEEEKKSIKKALEALGKKVTDGGDESKDKPEVENKK